MQAEFHPMLAIFHCGPERVLCEDNAAANSRPVRIFVVIMVWFLLKVFRVAGTVRDEEGPAN